MSEDPTEADQAIDQPPAELAALSDRLRALAQQPVADHPAVLEAVHRAVVAELEDLGNAGRALPTTAPRRADR